jgi:murein DD-endopeptidase MepM/ murein hydrolase activator NlpD
LEHKRITIIITSGKGGWTYSASMSRALAWTAAFAIVLIILGLVVTLALYGRVAALASRAGSLERENVLLKTQNERVADLASEVDRLRTFEAKILSIMGIDTLNVQRGSLDDAFRVQRLADSLDLNQGPVQFQWPARGVISRGYKSGPGTGSPHFGLDIAGDSGSPVVAALSGYVAFAGVDSVFGKMIVLDHGNGLSTLYGHNSKLLVKEGDMVEGGQLIARLGSTGRSSAPHLHFEVRVGGTAIDPLKYLSKKR